MKYLIVAAHPDDEILGCGGSIAKWVNNGHQVDILIIAEGVTSRSFSRNREANKKELLNLSSMAQRSSKIVGANSIELLDYPDNRLDSIELLDLIKVVEAKVEKIEPEIVVTHHFSDLNIDHCLVHKAVITACRPQPGHIVKRIMSFEVPSSTEWQSISNNQPFVPNWFEDISKTLSVKLDALNIYKSEMYKWPHARSIKSVKSLANWRGASIGCESAEAFILLRNLN